MKDLGLDEHADVGDGAVGEDHVATIDVEAVDRALFPVGTGHVTRLPGKQLIEDINVNVIG